MRQLTFPEFFPIYPIVTIGFISAFVIAPHYTLTAVWAALMIGSVLAMGVSTHRVCRS